MSKRWIAIHDSILDNWVWTADKSISKGQAFIELCMMASYKDKEISFNGRPMQIKRGQFVTSQRKLSIKWGWDVKKVSRFLKDLKASEMIDFDCEKCHTQATIITVLNYCKFQDIKNTNSNSDAHIRTTSGQHSDNSDALQSTNNTKDIQMKQYIGSTEQEEFDEFEDETLPECEVEAWEKEHGRKWTGWIQH